MNLCNCLQCNTNNCPAAKEFNDLQKQSNAQLDELRRISEALGTNEGHSSVTHIEILKEENAALREQLKQVEAGYATRNDEVTGLLGMNAELREQLAALREQLEDCKATLRELDLTGIQYLETPVAAVGRMRGIAMGALNRLP